MEEVTSNMPEFTGLTFEKVWAMFQETDRRFQETARQFKETDRKFQETERLMKMTDKKLGGLQQSVGNLAEHMVLPNIIDKFNMLGYTFSVLSHGMVVRGPGGKVIAEVDYVLENGDIVMLVEVKVKLRVGDIDRQKEKMEMMRGRFDKKEDKRKLIGALAAAVVFDNEKTYAFKNGFYVLEQVSDTFRIDAPPGFKPRKW